MNPFYKPNFEYKSTCIECGKTACENCYRYPCPNPSDMCWCDGCDTEDE